MLEALESRRLFSWVLAGATLEVTGTAANNTILFSQDPATGALVLNDDGAVSFHAPGTVAWVVVHARGGNDRVISSPGIGIPFLMLGEGGHDTLLGGEVNDSLFGGNGADVLRGRYSDDLLDGEAGNDTLYGGSGNDTLRGGIGYDFMYGEAGDDHLDAADGAADGTVDGGADMDDGLWDALDPLVAIP